MYMGIDVGTSAVKAAVVDEAGSVVDQASAPLSVSRPHALVVGTESGGLVVGDQQRRERLALAAAQGRARHRPVRSDARRHAARQAASRACARRFCGTTAAARGNAPSWKRRVPEMTQITGNRAMPGFTAPKLLWVRAHEPKIFAATAMVLLPKDYVRLRMTGETASDMSDSAGTLWLDVAQRRWSEAMLAATGLDESHMPALFEGNEITGELRAELAEAWGMPRVPVVAGGGDNAAGAIGVGVVRPGRCLPVARHLRRAVPGQRRLSAESRRRRAHLLSCGARSTGIRCR